MTKGSTISGNLQIMGRKAHLPTGDPDFATTVQVEISFNVAAKQCLPPMTGLTTAGDHHPPCWMPSPLLAEGDFVGSLLHLAIKSACSAA